MTKPQNQPSRTVKSAKAKIFATAKVKTRARKGNGAVAPSKGGGDLNFENKLWAAANELKGTMDAAEYKHVVLGLIFLKYVSDAFADRHRQLQLELSQGAD